MKNSQKIILVIILSFGFVLRVLPIKWGLPSRNLALSTYHPDEQISFHSLEQMNPKKLDFYPRQALDWGSFYIYFLGTTLKISEIFGLVKVANRAYYIQHLHETDRLYIIGRLISIFSGTLSIGILFMIIKNAFNDTTLALLGSGILGIVPIHLINSFYVRPDIFMVFFGLCAVYFSLKIIEFGKTRYYIFAAIFAGISTASKYIGGIFIFLPIIAHIIHYKNIFPVKNIFRLFLGFILTFIIACPYSLHPVFISHLAYLINQARIGNIMEQAGWIRYLTVFLPYGLGWLLFISALLGTVLLIFKNKTQKELFILLSGIIIYIMISLPKWQMTLHTLPIIPFLSIYTGYFLITLIRWKKPILSIAGKLIVISVLFYTTVYSLSYLNLFLGKNVREEASDWIEKNIPKTATVGIARSWFWTPPILRQYYPPYKLLMGGDVDSFLERAVLGLKEIAKHADYIVLTEFEYRQYLHPKLKKYFPQQAKILEEIFSGKNFIKIAEFDKEAKFLLFRFKKNYPPNDWLIPNPRIIVFKKEFKRL